MKSVSGGATKVNKIGFWLRDSNWNPQQHWEIPKIDSIKCASNFKFPTGMWSAGFCLNDTPTWPGFSGVNEAHDLQQRNIDTVMAIFDTNQAPSSTAVGGLRGVLNAADQYGLKVVLSFQGLIASPSFQSMTHAQRKAALEPFVQEAMAHDSLWMYYLNDEPMSQDGINFTIDLQSIFNELDPSRISFSANSMAWNYLPDMVDQTGMPIAAPEAYPLWNRPYYVAEGDYRNAWFPDGNPQDLTVGYDAIYNQLGSYAVTWPLVQAFGEQYPAPSWDWRAPYGLTELKCMTGLALAKKAQGIFYFSYYLMGFYGDYANLMPAIATIAQRLRMPVGAVLRETVPVSLVTSVSGGGSSYYSNGVAQAFEAYDGALYLVVVNRRHSGSSTMNVYVTTSVSGRTVTIGNVADMEGLVGVTATQTGGSTWRFTLTPSAGDFVLVRIGKISF